MLLSAEQSCPCGSGKPIKNCCLRADGSLRPEHWRSNLPGEKTGIINSKCYVSNLANCSSQISREHFISEGILKLAGDDGLIEMEGLSWQPEGEKKWLSTRNLTANVLCRRHNSGLSDIDKVGIDLFKSLLNANIDFSEGRVNSESVHLFNGHDVERWMLKTLCGAVASGNAETRNYDALGWRPPTQWLEILFEDKEMPEGFGMYYISREGSRQDLTKKVSFSALSNPYWGVYGAVLIFNGHEFVLAMRAPETRRGTMLEHSLYRPLELVMTGHSGQRVIMFGWEQPGDNKSVLLGYT